MAKAASLKIKLLSTADTGYFYVTKKNARTKTEKFAFKKYDPDRAQARRVQGNEDQVGLSRLRAPPFSLATRRHCPQIHKLGRDNLRRRRFWGANPMSERGLGNQCVILVGGVRARDGAGAGATPGPLVESAARHSSRR